MFGASAPFVDAESFYRDTAAQIHEVVAELAKVYLAEDPDLVLPAALLEAGAVEARFAAYAPRFA